MLNKIFLLMGILCFTLAQSQICESYDPNFSKFQLSDFGYAGNVQSITATFLKKNEQGEFQPSDWQTIRLHLNFDEQGKIISEFGVDHKMDTCKITLYSYNERNLVSQVKYYEKGLCEESTTTDLRNWQMSEALFEYDAVGNPIKRVNHLTYGHSIIMYEYDSKGLLIKERVLDNTSETNSTTHKIEYEYDHKNKLIKKTTTNEHQPNESGITVYHYENDLLVSEIFTPFNGTTGRKTLYQKSKMNTFQGDDTMTNYTKKVLDDSGKLVKSFHHYDGDGEFKSNIDYFYKYDENKNLIEMISQTNNEIAYSREENTVEYQKTTFDIIYY